MADISANIGWVSDYVFRGIFQEETSAFGGFDYNHDSGFYIGTWGADVGQGLETDAYFGFSGGKDFTYTVGYTAYRYTDDFDGDYDEINLAIGYGIFSLEYNIGEYSPIGGDKADYTFGAITIAPEKGPYYKFGSWGDDFDGDYFEIGYNTSLEQYGVDLSIALISSDDLPVDKSGAEYTLTFGITKNIGFGE